MIGAVTFLLAFLVFGSHVVLPWRLATRPTPRRRGWALLALPSLFVVLLTGGWWLSSHPDTLLGAGWGSRSVSDLIVRSLAVTLPVLILVDSVLLVGWRKLEDLGWRLAAGLGLVASLSAGAFLELLRTGEGPWSRPAVLAFATACHGLVALAAGEATTGRATGPRPVFAPLAALALPLYLFLLPEALRDVLHAEGWGITALACGLLLFAARWLPPRLRRPALFAAIALWSLFLGLASETSTRLPHSRAAPVVLPGV
ncbi:MAG: hypothetical protein AAF481_09085 [Acidobacteriota bacterium]